MPPKRIILKSSSSGSGSGSSSSVDNVGQSGKNQRPKRNATVKKVSPSLQRATRNRAKAALPSPKRTGRSSMTKEVESDLVLSSASSTSESEGDEEDKQSKDDLEISSVSDQEDLVSGSIQMNEFSSSSDEETMSQAPSETHPSRLTARQRALLQAEEMSLDSSPSLDTLNSFPRKLTEEEQLKKSEKSRRRKTQRDQKLEQSKAETVQRLLQKQGSRSKKMRQTPTPEHSIVSDQAPAKMIDPVESIKDDSLRLISRKEETVLLLGCKIPEIQQSPIMAYPKAQKCSVKGCANSRTYLHSKTGQPICSLNCYRSIKVL